MQGLSTSSNLKWSLLKYLRSQEIAFPYVARLAKYILGCPASSGSSERLFFEAGFFVNNMRSNLSTATLQRLVYIRSVKKGARKAMKDLNNGDDTDSD
jgi:hypothetical protein